MEKKFKGNSFINLDILTSKYNRITTNVVKNSVIEENEDTNDCGIMSETF